MACTCCGEVVRQFASTPGKRTLGRVCKLRNGKKPAVAGQGEGQEMIDIPWILLLGLPPGWAYNA